jgi:predicted amidohydrolase YtcJ
MRNVVKKKQIRHEKSPLDIRGLAVNNKNRFSICLLFSLLLPTASLAETLLHNMQAYTSTDDGVHEFTALVFNEDGRILATGDDDLLTEYADAKRIDADGKYMLPGLVDAHAHLYGQGFLTISLDLAGTPSLEEAVAQIAAYASNNPRSPWILGRGWNQVLWAVQEFPKASDIDPVINDRPVWLRRIDGHAGWANTRALEIAGIDDETADPIGGKIVRDDNGKATGILIDKAMGLMGQHIPGPDKDEIRATYLKAIESLVALGMTGMHDAGISIVEAEVLIALADDSALDMRVYAMLSDSGANLDAMGEPLKGYGNDRLDIQAVKLYSDGALGSRGAAMIEPYADDVENRGLPFWTQDELDSFVQKANSMGFQVGIHAIGDLGNRMALDAFEKAQGGEPSPLRNRIEHSQIITLEDIPRFAELGVIAAMQPIHATSDMNMAEDRLGPDRILGGYAWRRLLDSGAIIASGSDFPVEKANPFLGLYAAVTRQDAAGLPAGGWYADQALTRAEALHSFTLAAAFAAHQEDRLGSLEAGKWADFIIVDRDYFTIPAAEIDDIQVIQTWVGGQLVFDASE